MSDGDRNAFRETPQERALITIAIIYRLFAGGDRSDQVLIHGMEQANLLITSDLRVRQQYDALVRIFREAQARDAEWCARQVAQLAIADDGEPPIGTVVSLLHGEAARVRARLGEMEDSEWPSSLRSMRLSVDDSPIA